MNFGSVLIIISFVISIAALVFFVLSATGKKFLLQTSKILYLSTSALIFISVILLLVYLLNNDFRFLYVHDNSSSDLPFYYLISAFWAGKEGSFLLWLFLLNIFGIIVLFSDENSEIVMSVILLTQVFMIIILLVENPFIYIWDKYPQNFNPGEFPRDGAGLNPLLKDPWMIIHPPVLFLGYASATIPFGYAIAALVKNEYKDWIARSYKWVISSMVTLGVGIFLGGYWAYKVLGWGGYWGWDPVENSSLIPWLVVLALMHGMLLQKRKNLLVKANLFLAMLYFVLVFYSTYLTRSGDLSNFSVHSFGGSEISAYLRGFLVCFIVISAAALIWRFKKIKSEKFSADVMDWKTLTIYGMMVLVLYSIVILVGTSMPLISSIFMQKPTSVNINFYNNISIPFVILILGLMVFSTMLIASKKKFLDFTNILICIVSIVLGILLNITVTKSPIAYIFTIISLYVIGHKIYDLIDRKSIMILPSRLTHIGVAIMVIGIIASNYHSSKLQKKLTEGVEEKIGTISLTFNGFQKGKFSSLKFSVRQDDSIKEFETAYYFNSRTESWYREPHIESGIIGDIYITPEKYHSGADNMTAVVLKKGEEKNIGKLKVKFLKFETEFMRSKNPKIHASLNIDGKLVSPGIRFGKGKREFIDAKIPGTDREVSLKGLDANKKMISIYISPGKEEVIPKDTVLVDVSYKRLIWLVWLGTIVIALGGAAAFVVSSRKS